jgi:conjugal transfer pilus assembly protein TraB
MLLGGKSEDKEPKGPMAGFKKKWRKLEPKKQKTITLIIFALAIVVFAGLGYHSRQNRTHKMMKGHEPEARESSLNTDVIEKSLFRQAQDTINQQGKLIADMRKEIAKVKAATEEAARKNNSSPGRAGIALPPPGKKGEGRAEHQTRAEARSPVPRYYSPPPPPPPSSFSAGSKKGEEESSLFGGITVIANASPPENTKEAPKKKYRIYLSPSFMEATLLSGLDAPTTTAGKSNPVPVLLRIKDLAILPNKVKADLKGCFVLAEGKGNLASERVDVRLLTLSCVSKKGQAVIDQKVKGYVVDEDGKAGLRGIVSAKMGALLARSALAGFLGGMGDAIKSSTMNLQTTALGTQTQVWGNNDTKNIVRGGIGGGISEASKDLEKFYLQLAQQTLPIIQVGATKTVTVVVSEGVNLEVKNAEIIK